LVGFQIVLKQVSVFDGTPEPLRQSLFGQMDLAEVFVFLSARDAEPSGQVQKEFAPVWR
jgi:hypothetical protein